MHSYYYLKGSYIFGQFRCFTHHGFPGISSPSDYECCGTNELLLSSRASRGAVVAVEAAEERNAPPRFLLSLVFDPDSSLDCSVRSLCSRDVRSMPRSLRYRCPPEASVWRSRATIPARCPPPDKWAPGATYSAIPSFLSPLALALQEWTALFRALVATMSSLCRSFRHRMGFVLIFA